jgi:hypothetical protein
MQGLLSVEIEKFHAQIRARALLIAVEWAGGVEALGKMIGFERSVSRKWVSCGRIPPLCALALSRISGFPLGFEEMCPSEDMRIQRARRCPHCDLEINPPNRRAASSLLLRACSEATARKRAARPAKKPKTKTKQRAAKP